MRYVLLLLVLFPVVMAHEAEEEHAPLYSTDGAYAASNSFDGVNPFLLASQNRFGQALFALALWVGMLAGLLELIKLVLARAIE